MTYLDKHDCLGLFGQACLASFTMGLFGQACLASFTKPPVGVSKFYQAGLNPYLANINNNIFILGTLDLFVTSSKTELEEAIKAEIKDKIDNIEEEIIGD